jgi:hypothetical protein
MAPASLIENVLRQAVAEVALSGTEVFTFALYFDHESSALSVCVDTEVNSAKTVAQINRYNAKYFHQAVGAADLKMAELWQANAGRSLSLGDFALVNVARTDVPPSAVNEQFFLGLVEELVRVEDRVVQLAPTPEKLVFACSSANEEVAYVWSAARDA